VSDPDPEVRARAARALGAVREERARDALFVLARDENPLVRGAASESLTRLGVGPLEADAFAAVAAPAAPSTALPRPPPAPSVPIEPPVAPEEEIIPDVGPPPGTPPG
jgi:HEAT repeat protein